jgi:hypothetical protein
VNHLAASSRSPREPTLRRGNQTHSGAATLRAFFAERAE